MQRSIMRKGICWWGWKSEEFELYLEKMGKQGYRTVTTGFGHTIITFVKDTPKNIRYCVDYQSHITDEYIQIIEDDGWELIKESLGWYLWAKPYTEERPNLFTDKASLLERNTRLLNLLYILLFSQIPIFFSLTTMLQKSRRSISFFFYLVYLCVIGFYVFAIYHLKKQQKDLLS